MDVVTVIVIIAAMAGNLAYDLNKKRKNKGRSKNE